MPVKNLDSEMPCMRHKVSLHGSNIYIIIVYSGNDPVEVFATVPHEWQLDKHRVSTIESLNRCVSLMLRAGIDRREVVGQLQKGSEAGTYPAILAELLK